MMLYMLYMDAVKAVSMESALTPIISIKGDMIMTKVSLDTRICKQIWQMVCKHITSAAGDLQLRETRRGRHGLKSLFWLRAGDAENEMFGSWSQCTGAACDHSCSPWKFIAEKGDYVCVGSKNGNYWCFINHNLKLKYKHCKRVGNKQFRILIPHFKCKFTGN